MVFFNKLNSFLKPVAGLAQNIRIAYPSLRESKPT